jgi:broad specificity phosphatase PhoE
MAEEHEKVIRPAGAPMVPSSAGGPAPAEAPDRSGGIAAVGTTVVDEAKEAGVQAASAAGSRAREELDRRSTQAGDRVGSAAGDVRDIAQGLRDKGRDGPARVADDAAERIERFAAYLRDADTDRILADVRSLSRRQPAAVVAGAAVIGIVAGRLLKASEPSDRSGRSTP